MYTGLFPVDVKACQKPLPTISVGNTYSISLPISQIHLY